MCRPCPYIKVNIYSKAIRGRIIKRSKLKLTIIVNNEKTIEICIGNIIKDIIEPFTRRLFSAENKLNNVFSEKFSKKTEFEFMALAKDLLLNTFPKEYANLCNKKDVIITEQ